MAVAAWPAGVGRVLLPSIDSTNAEAMRRAPDLSGPCWFLAEAQTAGRGRRARPWVSPRGNLYVTLLLQPTEPPQIVALRSFVAALALRDALLATGVPAEALALKWPNDVLLGGGKVAGILLESQSLPGTASQAPRSSALAIGIGVNLIGHPDPTAVEPGAVLPVSVHSQTGLQITPEVFLTALATAYAGWEGIFVTQGFAPIRAAWLAHAARLGTTIRARTGTQDRVGVFETIDADGNLMLRMAEGMVAIPAAEVFF
jgi:BirA family transcriptional regulator, biotin operon repressor / biotin---[acetyl-CoA-carboxylase] ligase